MNLLLQVTERDISVLENHELRPLLNQLLLAEARRYKIPSSCIETTGADNIGDGGIDARINHSVEVTKECRIPLGLSVWQYKAGHSSVKAIEKVESQKIGVQESIAENGSYCFIVGERCTDPMRRNRVKALDKAFHKLGKTPKGRLFTAADIAEWVSDHPVLAESLLKFRLPDYFYTFQEWTESGMPGAKIEYQLNESRKQISSSIVDLIEHHPQAVCIRITGMNGIGKTRLVLETIHKAEAASFTFYAATPENIPDSFFNYVQSRTSIKKLILVVDECDEKDFRRLLGKAQQCNGRIILITIGVEELEQNGEIETNIFYFSVDKLNYEAIERVVDLTAPRLPIELRLYIANIANGYVKIATALAESLSTNQSIGSISELMALPKIDFILKSIVKNEEEHDAMRALSLLRFLGLDEEVMNEGQAVAEFLNLDFGKLIRVSFQMEKRGLVIKRGRYRYVTPTLLAISYAKEVWQIYRSSAIVNKLIPRLSSSARLRLLDRLGNIGEESIALPVVEKYFGPYGELANIDAIDNENIANQLSVLANAAPVFCSQSLRRIFRDVPVDRLSEFRAGRRQIIHTLEYLLRLKATFIDAAQILLKLAESENEIYGNNATGIWQQIFYVRSGLSPLPAWERHSLIRDAVSGTNSIKMRLLGVTALYCSLTHTEQGVYSASSGGHLPERWQPSTWDEVWRSHRSALEILDQLLADPDEQLRQSAISTLIKISRMLFRTPLKTEIMGRLGNLIHHPNMTLQKKELINALEEILEYEAGALSTLEIETIQQWQEQLYGNSYHDRLQRWVGDLTQKDRERIFRVKENSIDINQILANLAKEAYENPSLLDAEFEWLASPASTMSSQFAFVLGLLDEERIWLTKLISYLPGATYLVVGYLLGREKRGDTIWLEEVLGEWIQEQPTLAMIAFHTLQKLEGSDKRALWIIALVEKDWVQREHLELLRLGGWLDTLSEEVFVRLLKVLIGNEPSKYIVAALSMVHHWITLPSQHNTDTAQFFVSLLNELPVVQNARHYDPGWYYWQQICMFYLRAFLLDIVQIAVRFMGDHMADISIGPEDERLFILNEALKISPETVWPVIGAFLLDSEHNNNWYLTSSMFRDGKTLSIEALFETMEHSKLVQWIDDNRPLAPQVVAKYIRTEQTPLPALARDLLIKYGDDPKVRGHLNPRSRGLSWNGSLTNRLQVMLNTMRSWLNDTNKIVRDWAMDIIQDTEQAMRREEQREDEGDLFWK